MHTSRIACNIHSHDSYTRIMVFNTTFDNISAISWWSVLLMEETGVLSKKPTTRRKSLTNFITQCSIEYTSPCTGIESTTLVVTGTDCTGSCKSNYHTITTKTAPELIGKTSQIRQIKVIHQQSLITTISVQSSEMNDI